MSEVLLVEDDAGVAEALALALTSLGHDVQIAPDATRGLAALARLLGGSLSLIGDGTTFTLRLSRVCAQEMTIPALR